jgi:hypothetical protein
MQYDSINDQIFVKTDFIHLGSVYGVGIGSSNAVNKGMVGLTVDGKISSSMAIETLSHITASGNISANGAGPHNFGGNIYVDTDKYIGEQSEGGRIRFRGSSVIVTEGSFNTNNNTTLGTALGDEITIKGHITASGNISSSGQLIAASADFNEGNITNVGEISVDKVIADTTTEVVLSLSTAGMAFGVDAGDVYQFNEGEIDADWKYIDAANDVLIHGDAGLSRVGIGTTTPSSKLTVHGDISASGDIMGVGTLYMSGEKGDPSSSIDGDGAKFWSTAVGAPFFNLENSHASLGMPGFNIGYAGDNMGEAPISIRGTVKNSLGGALEPFYPEQNTLSIFSGSITNNLPKGFNVRLGDNDYDDGVRVGIRKLRPTKELEVNGDISASGQYFGNQILITHHLADIAESTERNIPAPSYFIDNTSNIFLYRWIAPYDGELEKILVHPSGTPGSTVMTLYAGTGATDKKDSVTVDMSSADTTYTFPCTSGSTITAGDLIKVGYNASADSDQVSFTCVWKYKII